VRERDSVFVIGSVFLFGGGTIIRILKHGSMAVYQTKKQIDQRSISQRKKKCIFSISFFVGPRNKNINFLVYSKNA
jgi:hypothetical protein